MVADNQLVCARDHISYVFCYLDNLCKLNFAWASICKVDNPLCVLLNIGLQYLNQYDMVFEYGPPRSKTYVLKKMST